MSPIARKITTACVCLVALPASAPAQQSPFPTVRWWEVAIVAGTIGAVSAFDRGVDVWIQHHRSSSSDDLAKVLRHGGQPEVVFGVPAGMLAAGLIGGSKDLERRAGRVFVSVVVAGLATAAIKEGVGRVRPDSATNQYLFRPFTHHDSFPSGHTTVAFAFATSLGEEIHRPWASALLYAGAAGTGWSRLNDHHHWLSDVLAGATVGFVAGKIVEAHPPRILAGPGGARLEWHVAF